MSTRVFLKITYYGSIFKVVVEEKDVIISGETKIKSGDTIFINFKQGKILFFNYESQAEI